MNHKPIPFNGDMVRAILDGRKTMTRRAIRYRPEDLNHPAVLRWQVDSEHRAVAIAQSEEVVLQYVTTFPRQRILCPYGKPGDLLWVREAWRTGSKLDADSPKRIAERAEEAGFSVAGGEAACPIRYEADGFVRQWGDADEQDFGMWGRYRHSRFMPKWASRLTLVITDIRVERLQDISEEDAISEGMQILIDRYKNKISGRIHSDWWYRYCFQNYIDEINGNGTWDANPWVWIISFRPVRQNVLDYMKETDIMIAESQKAIESGEGK